MTITIIEEVGVSLKKIRISKIGDIYHVGTMDITKKSNFSLEGNGLSISTWPDEWRKITGGTINGACFKLEKYEAIFLDFHELNDKDKLIITNLAIEQGYIQESTLYKYHFQDECDEDVYFVFETHAEALLEACDLDEPDEAIEPYVGIKPTEKLIKDTLVKIDLANCFDLITAIYAEKVLKLDGIWWNDVLDVYSYSAPRGVIFNSRLREFNVTMV